jgi:predicted Rdx family selenoprotein
MIYDGRATFCNIFSRAMWCLQVYFQKYTQDLGKVLGSELGGQMERITFNCLQGAEEAYDPQFHTADKAVEDADVIHKKGKGRWGTDEKGIFKIVCAAPKEHLENINKVYSDKFGYSLQKALEQELGGLMESGCKQATVHMIGMKLKPYETIAELIKSACAGIGTDELLLTCCLIRYQGVMQEVMSAHIELFGQSVHERVRKETGGKYKALLLQILNTVWPEQG